MIISTLLEFGRVTFKPLSLADQPISKSNAIGAEKINLNKCSLQYLGKKIFWEAWFSFCSSQDCIFLCTISSFYCIWFWINMVQIKIFDVTCVFVSLKRSSNQLKTQSDPLLISNHQSILNSYYISSSQYFLTAWHN